MSAAVVITLQLPAGLTLQQALASALRYPSIRQWQDEGGTVWEYDAVTGIARFPVPA